MKRCLIIAAAALLAALTLAGCAVTDKAYGDKGFNITLPSNFKTYDAEGYDVCYDTKDCAVFALKEAFDQAEGFGDLSLREYTELVLEANGLDNAITETDKYMYFEFEKTVDDSSEPYEYLACCYRAEDAFWLVQFSCAKSDYDRYRPKMLEWADTVYFGE